ncbi:MAG: NlpC/P60 family protein [Bacteroidia bacterium]
MTNHRFPLASFAIREHPSHKSQLVTEILYGQRFCILEVKESWKKVKNFTDGYIGWIEFNHSFLPDELPLFVAQSPNCLITEKGNIQIYPGAEIHATEASRLVEPNIEKSLIALAKSYLGTPYLWGGKTKSGIDCSGFIQCLFATKQLNLPRDAYQQAEIGKTVDFDNLKAGDIAFFKNNLDKITHVGLIIENDSIIHASEMVRIDKLTKNGIWNDELQKETHHLSHIKRLV